MTTVTVIVCIASCRVGSWARTAVCCVLYTSSVRAPQPQQAPGWQAATPSTTSDAARHDPVPMHPRRNKRSTHGQCACTTDLHLRHPSPRRRSILCHVALRIRMRVARSVLLPPADDELTGTARTCKVGSPSACPRRSVATLEPPVADTPHGGLPCAAGHRRVAMALVPQSRRVSSVGKDGMDTRHLQRPLLALCGLSPRRVLQALCVDGVSRKLHVAYDRPTDEHVFHRQLHGTQCTVQS